MDPRLAFNEVAAEYDRLRPGFIPELYEDIFAYSGIDASWRVLEIGIGTGQATLPILDTGCSVTAVEIGDKLAEFTRQKFSDRPNLSVITTAFEDYHADDGSFDMVYSANAFHWIPEDIGYPKVFGLLQSGGTFARFRNHPNPHKGSKQLNIEIQKLYDRYMPGDQAAPAGSAADFSEDQSQQIAEIARAYGFVDISYKLYHRTRTLSAEDYAALCCTYSNHLAIGAVALSAFAQEMKDVINSFGGTISIYDTIDLELARKP
jgi:SAM-dependent methyltransferase